MQLVNATVADKQVLAQKLANELSSQPTTCQVVSTALAKQRVIELLSCYTTVELLHSKQVSSQTSASTMFQRVIKLANELSSQTSASKQAQHVAQ